MWFNNFLSKYKSGISHEFLFYFNVKDNMDNTRNLFKYLDDEFIRQRNFGIVAFYDISRGLTFLEPAMEREFNKIVGNEAVSLFHSLPSKIFPLIDIALRGTKMALFIDHAEKIVPAGDIGSMTLEERMALIWMSEWSVNARISAVGSTIFMLTDNIADISREFLKPAYRIEPILVELPNEAERKEYIEFLLSDNLIKSEISIDEFAKLSSGLNRKSIKDIKLKAEAEGVPISFDFIKQKKDRLGNLASLYILSLKN